MNSTHAIRTALLLVIHLLANVAAASSGGWHTKPSIATLETQQQEIQAELNTLASYSLRGGVGAIGFRSQSHAHAHSPTWVRVQLREEAIIDQIVLVPAIWRHAREGFQADCFPIEFQLLAGTDAETNGTVVASFSREDHLLPRSAPVVVDIPPTRAAWVKLVATELSQRQFDHEYSLELAEMMVFRGQENLALHSDITASSVNMNVGRGTRPLTDGFVPYLMNAAQGERSIAVISTIKAPLIPYFSIDLGASYALDQINLHAVEQSDTVPQAFTGELGIPRLLSISGANHADFSDAIHLLDIRCESPYDAGPILMHRLPDIACRYIRLTALSPCAEPNRHPSHSRFGFTEIELLSNDVNVALHRPVTANFELKNTARNFSNLTDGLNLSGKILPMRSWMNQLARRQQLETQLALIQRQLIPLYAHQQTNIHRLSWLAALLAAGIAFTLLINRYLRLRQAHRMKERFAADLHDELGANLHAIGILGTHILDILDSPERLQRTVHEIKSLTDRAGEATRYCAALQSAEDAQADLAANLERTAQRILANLDYTIAIDSRQRLNSLKPRIKNDLFLFFKESLVNINRHADATTVTIEIDDIARGLVLRISDNGHGAIDSVPASLTRRARLLGGHVALRASETDGTCIELTLRSRRAFRNS